MAASPSSVLTEGFGVWGNVNLVLTLGYGTGEFVGYQLCGNMTIEPLLTGTSSITPRLAGDASLGEC